MAGLYNPPGRSPFTTPFTIHYSPFGQRIRRLEPKTPIAATPKMSGTLGRERPKLIRNSRSSGSPGASSQAGQSQTTIGPLTIVAENMTSEAVDRAIEDTKKADTELPIKDINGKVFQNNSETPERGEEEEEIGKLDENSELELLSNRNRTRNKRTQPT